MFLTLDQNAVDLYYASTLSSNPLLRHQMLETLNEEELKDYNRFKLETRKNQFLIGRYLIKSVCSQYLKKGPHEIVILKNDYGKPYLPGADLKFNLSHVDGMVVCAFTIGQDIGVDLEKVEKNITGLVKRFFAPKELDFIFKQEIGNQNRAAYRIWTMKEAYVKAVGKGLSISFNSFDLFDETDMFFYTTELKLNYYLSIAVPGRTKHSLKVRIKEIDLF